LPKDLVSALASAKLSPSDVLAELDYLSAQFTVKGFGAYLEVRDRWLFLNLYLNKLKLVAPAFRNYPAMAPFPVLDGEKFFALDVQLIDLHWLRCNGFKRLVAQPEFADMFKVSSFDWGRATDFVTTAVKAEHKATSWLSLSDFEMAQMRTLKSKASRTRHSDYLRPARGRSAFPWVMARLSEFMGESLNGVDMAEQEASMWFASKLLPGRPAAQQLRLYQSMLPNPVSCSPAVFAKKVNKICRMLANL